MNVSVHLLYFSTDLTIPRLEYLKINTLLYLGFLYGEPRYHYHWRPFLASLASSPPTLFTLAQTHYHTRDSTSSFNHGSVCERYRHASYI